MSTKKVYRLISNLMLLAISFAILLTPLGAAQNDNSPTAENKTAPGAGCALLTPAQIQKVLEQPFDAPKETKLLPPFGNQWGSHCTYTSQRAGHAVVDYWVYVVASAAEAKQWFDMGAAVAKPKSKPAIGDSAYIDASNGYIYVLKGKVYYWIAIAPGNEKQEKDLAASVAARI